jgi:hypothetical protein
VKYSVQLRKCNSLPAWYVTQLYISMPNATYVFAIHTPGDLLKLFRFDLQHALSIAEIKAHYGVLRYLHGNYVTVREIMGREGYRTVADATFHRLLRTQQLEKELLKLQLFT